MKVDWFCWILLIAGFLLVIGASFLHSRIGGKAVVWRIIGAVLALLALGLFFFGGPP